MHFSELSVMPRLLRRCRTSRSRSSCSRVILWTRMSSIRHTVPESPLSASDIRRWKCSGADDIPSWSCRKWWRPNGVIRTTWVQIQETGVSTRIPSSHPAWWRPWPQLAEPVSRQCVESHDKGLLVRLLPVVFGWNAPVWISRCDAGRSVYRICPWPSHSSCSLRLRAQTNVIGLIIHCMNRSIHSHLSLFLHQSCDAIWNRSKRQIHLAHSPGRLKVKGSGIETWNDTAVGCILTRYIGAAAASAAGWHFRKILSPLPTCNVDLVWKTR